MGLFRRGKVWWMSFTYQGKCYRRSTETTDQKLAQKILDKGYEIVQGKWFETGHVEVRTFKEMTERYLNEHVSKKKSQRAYREYVKNLQTFFDGCTLSEVTPELIDRYKEEVASRSETCYSKQRSGHIEKCI